MSMHKSEVTVAEIESRLRLRTMPISPSSTDQEGESLNVPFSAQPDREAPRLPPEIGMVPILQLVRSELSEVIEQGKAALMKPERVGLGMPGFDSVSITNLVNIVDGTMHICEHLVFKPELPQQERLLAVAFSGFLEKFQYCFFGLETESIGRSDMRSLLPALQEFKQLCLELELKLLLGEGIQELTEAA